MTNINHLVSRDSATVSALLMIWEGSVKATHTFLSDKEISDIKPEVYQALQTIAILCCYEDEHGVPQGFIGIDKQKIALLFVAENAREHGIGRCLVSEAIEKWQVNSVDVNEQNEQGLGFYQHMGFHVVSRSEVDAQGRPFPILHLAR
ncbi:acetyltransferase [Bacilli bacterium]|nr:acetyltransferase [Bacilli bacterium]